MRYPFRRQIPHVQIDVTNSAVILETVTFTTILGAVKNLKKSIDRHSWSRFYGRLYYIELDVSGRWGFIPTQSDSSVYKKKPVKLKY